MAITKIAAPNPYKRADMDAVIDAINAAVSLPAGGTSTQVLHGPSSTATWGAVALGTDTSGNYATSDAVAGSPIIGGSTVAALPAAGTSGRVRRVTDSTRGLWMDQGSQWFALNGEVANIKEFGAKGDGQIVTDGAITSGLAVLTSASGLFALSDVGKGIVVTGAGTAGANLVTSIASFQSTSQVTLTLPASTTVTGAFTTWATDDTAAIQNAIDSSPALTFQSVKPVWMPPGVYGFSTLRLKHYTHLHGAGTDNVRLVRLSLGGGGPAIAMKSGAIAEGISLADFSVFGNQIGVNLDGINLGTETPGSTEFALPSYMRDIRVAGASGVGINILSNVGYIQRITVVNFPSSGTPSNVTSTNLIGVKVAGSTLAGYDFDVQGYFPGGELVLNAGASLIKGIHIESAGVFSGVDAITITAANNALTDIIFINVGGTGTRRDLIRTTAGVTALAHVTNNPGSQVIATNILNDTLTGFAIPANASHLYIDSYRNSGDSAKVMEAIVHDYNLLTIVSPLVAGQLKSSYFGSSFPLTLAGDQDINGTANLLHNAYVLYNNVAETTYKWIATHASFGSRGITFGYPGAPNPGIGFYADSVATTKDVTFTPTLRFLIQNNGNIALGPSFTAAALLHARTDAPEWRIQSTKSDGTGNPFISFYNNNNELGRIQANTSSGDLAFSTGSTPTTRMTINFTTGNIGAGITANINERLTLLNAGYVGGVNAAGNASKKLIGLNASDQVSIAGDGSAALFGSTVTTKGYLGNVVAKTTTYTATVNDETILGDATTAAFTITLPDSSAANAGLRLHIEKKDSSANAVTISRAGTNTIEGATTVSLTTQYQSRVLIAGGDGVWYRESSL